MTAGLHAWRCRAPGSHQTLYFAAKGRQTDPQPAPAPQYCTLLQAGRACPCRCRPMTHPSSAHQIPLRGLGPHHARNFMQGAGQRTAISCLPRAGEPVEGGVQRWPGWRPQRVQHRWQVEGTGKLQVQALCPCCTGGHACKAMQKACMVKTGLLTYLCRVACRAALLGTTAVILLR